MRLKKTGQVTLYFFFANNNNGLVFYKIVRYFMLQNIRDTYIERTRQGQDEVLLKIISPSYCYAKCNKKGVPLFICTLSDNHETINISDNLKFFRNEEDAYWAAVNSGNKNLPMTRPKT